MTGHIVAKAHSDGMKHGRKDAIKERSTRDFISYIHKARYEAENLIDQERGFHVSEGLSLIYAKLIECGRIFEKEVKQD